MESYLFYFIGFIVIAGFVAAFLFRGDTQRVRDSAHKLGFKVFKGAGKFHHEIQGLDQSIINPRSPDIYFYKKMGGCKLSAFHFYHFRGPTVFCAVIEPADGPWPAFRIHSAGNHQEIPEVSDFSGGAECRMQRLLSSPVRDLITQKEELVSSRTLMSKEGKLYYIRRSETASLEHFLGEINTIAESIAAQVKKEPG